MVLFNSRWKTQVQYSPAQEATTPLGESHHDGRGKRKIAYCVKLFQCSNVAIGEIGLRWSAPSTGIDMFTEAQH
ncbi:hypothetical protein V495_02147 [Pseudogymnoascus sp. VKM F-4514 (FW-929)]|nr:hypothetical protein V495_02147 [Pseudogymnoascus sp. VKM F-4514 (FW-929)]KFY56409.1 hypothetical protein V497_06289 [Pseudogymnoascus sp. VKM F-4516 (FW-969)]